ncbi:MAG: hypothetical protein IKL83_05405 [Muribaculaceae bacterium]|nr:hypothetical protein [Muribaculaceae bacterium]
MKRIAQIILVVAFYIVSTATITAQSPNIGEISTYGKPCKDFKSHFIINENILGSTKIKLDSLTNQNPHINEKVIVDGDTVNFILPDKNYGRYDRGLYNYLIIPKKQWSIGITASYGEFGTDDVQVLSILENFDIKINTYSIKPSISYFFTNNQSVGIKFNYTSSEVDLANMTFDFDDDLNFSLRDVSYNSHTFSASLNYRNYIGLGPEKRFAIFNEIDLGFGLGSSEFKRLYNDEPRNTQTDIMKASLNFSPGVCMFIMDYISFNVSFGVFGLNLTHEKQTTNGVDEGSRFSSGANFKFNLFNINFGLAVHI